MIMKKYLFLAASALALASCSSDDIIGNNGGGQQSATNAEITFGANPSANSTRAGQLTKGDAAAALENNFVVVGFKGEGKTAANASDYAFDHYNVNYLEGTAGSTTSNTANWEYVGQDMKVKGTNPSASLAESAKEQTIKYWDHSCKTYDFLAFSMGKGKPGDGDISTTSYATPSKVDKANLATAAYTLNGDINTLSECYISDITTVKEADYSAATVNMNFRHLTSKVRIALYETVPGYVIKDVEFYESSTSTDAKNTAQFYGMYNTKGIYTVYFPKTGTDNKDDQDYNKAHVKFQAETDGQSTVMDFGKVNYNNEKENQIVAGTTYLAQTASNPSYCGATAEAYQTVLPTEGASQPATIRINYTLVATDGTEEEIHVKNATATVPAAYTEWKHGYAYTYKFKISQNTNGFTGDDPEKSGLTAISFDAVVADDEATGQETITTVSTPSITTYGFDATNKVVSVNKNEYAPGTDIYATVYVPAKDDVEAQTAAPQKLYTIELTGGTDPTNAAQTINEASVANAIANGNKADINGYTLSTNEVTTSATIATTVPTKDGRDITVPALKWTAGAANTIYAVEYTDAADNKTYKIVKIAE